MFVITELKDTVTISPWQFKQRRLECIKYTLNKKYANKVGLVITKIDIGCRLAIASLFVADRHHANKMHESITPFNVKSSSNESSQSCPPIPMIESLKLRGF